MGSSIITITGNVTADPQVHEFDTGTRIYANYLQLYDAHYSLGVTQFTRGFRAAPNLSNTFLSSPVFNFTTAFSGPEVDTAYDAPNAGFNTAGIWNAADVMDSKFTQRYQQAEFAADLWQVYIGHGADEYKVPAEFFALDNCVLFPHVASATVETRKAMGDLQVENLHLHFAGKPVRTPISA